MFIISYGAYAPKLDTPLILTLTLNMHSTVKYKRSIALTSTIQSTVKYIIVQTHM